MKLTFIFHPQAPNFAIVSDSDYKCISHRGKEYFPEYSENHQNFRMKLKDSFFNREYINLKSSIAGQRKHITVHKRDDQWYTFELDLPEKSCINIELPECNDFNCLLYQKIPINPQTRPSAQRQIDQLKNNILSVIDSFAKKLPESTPASSSSNNYTELHKLKQELNRVKTERDDLRSTVKRLSETPKVSPSVRAQHSHGNQQINSLILGLVETYQAKHLSEVKGLDEIKGSINQLHAVTNRKIDALEKLVEKLKGQNSPIATIKTYLNNDTPEKALELLTNMINSDSASDTLDLEQVQERVRQIISIIWEQNYNKESSVKAELDILASLIGLEITEPKPGTTFNGKEHKIVERRPKRSGMPYKAIIEVQTPCIQVQSTGKVLDKAKVVIAD